MPAHTYQSYTGSGQKNVTICQTNVMVIFISNFVILQE